MMMMMELLMGVSQPSANGFVDGGNDDSDKVALLMMMMMMMWVLVLVMVVILIILITFQQGLASFLFIS